MRVRPRRALPAPIAVRLGRVAGPAVAVGALITTAAVTAWPSTSMQAVPLDAGIPTVTASVPCRLGPFRRLFRRRCRRRPVGQG